MDSGGVVVDACWHHHPYDHQCGDPCHPPPAASAAAAVGTRIVVLAGVVMTMSDDEYQHHSPKLPILICDTIVLVQLQIVFPIHPDVNE